jgi:hypothetical protein
LRLHQGVTGEAAGAMTYNQSSESQENADART